MQEETIKLAFSIYYNPGVYALLLGSGVSRAAEIPTGWEIVLDLIKKVALIMGEDPEPDPEKWYYNKFKKEPSYSDILKSLAASPSERRAFLHSYFEPTEEEREEGKKAPTEAHKAIASLVKNGYIRMIITTNFDRLIETAIKEQGIEPDVISTDDALKGTMPYVHTKCTIVKLHGDYRDIRIKNTPSELALYSGKLNKYLNSILDDFGLIICGWSGEWDTALRNAILRCKSRRFTTYWTTLGKISDEASQLIKHRKAEVIQIESADKFFTEIKENVEALQELEYAHPISVSIAVERVKKYLAEDKFRIKLYDLITEEIEDLYKKLASPVFKPKGQFSVEEEFKKRVDNYEALVEILFNMIVTLSWFDTEGKYSELITRSIERLSKKPWEEGIVILQDLQRYAALLLLYGIGISSVSRNSYNNLYAALTSAVLNNFGDRVLAYKILNAENIFENNFKKIIGPNNVYAPELNKIALFCRKGFSQYIPDDRDFLQKIDIFEYLLGLIYFDIDDEKKWTPTGNYLWRRYSRRSTSVYNPIDKFIEYGTKQGNGWNLLKAGFFDGSIERFKESQEQFSRFLAPKINNIRWHYD